MELRTALPTSVLLGGILGAAAIAVGSPEKQDGLLFSSLFPSAPAAPMETVEPVATEAAVSWDIPVVWNESVQKFVKLFEEKQPERMALYLKRSGRYEGMIRSKLREQGMPEDLVYMSMIESGFNPNAKSHAQAVGLWQFIAETGRRYGLRVDSYVDERRDPEKSTDAALRYLQDLHDRFGSWYLAAAAYNTGENRVGRIMREETGSERGAEEDFWRIRKRLPGETREYVPLIVAAALIGKEPHKYGLENVERWLPVPTDSVAVPGGTDLEVVAEAVGVTEKEIRVLNPHLVRGATPPGKGYTVRIPEGRASLYAVNFSRAQTEMKSRMAAKQAEQARLAKAKAKPKSTKTASATKKKGSTKVASAPRRHKVRRGESLSVIAKRHGTSVVALQRANSMGKRTGIRAGQTLRIPG
jgi:membrane-bound lytic murein transglycosylase D